MSTVQTKQTNLREKLAELLDFRKMRDRLSGLGLYIGKDRTGTDENLLVRGGANVDDLQIGEIAALVGGNAVDVFVYDTSRDSDGGKWRERTQHTSWYNEELNTATRGGRREFPAVAVIVAEAGKVTIYDGDDPDLSMWMVFEGTYLGIDIVNILTSDDTRPLSSVFALQGILCIGVSALNGFEYINFVDDSAGYYRASISGVYNGGILERNDGKGKTVNSGSFLVDNTVNDVAMTILPNAPIDGDTGLPVPTIAVATDGGVSVIKDDGTVVDSVSTANFNSITFNNSTLYSTRGTSAETWRFDDYSSDGFSGNAYHNKSTRVIEIVPLGGQGVDSLYSDEDLEIASANGLSRIHENSDLNKGMLAYTTSKYNTGWMPGDIKLATLSDTTVETIGVNSDELLTGNNSTFDSSVGDWASHLGAVLSVDTNRLKITPSNTNNYSGARLQLSNLNIGTIYEFKVQYTAGSNIEQIYIDVHEGSGATDFNNKTTISQDGYSSYHFTATQSTMHLYIRYSDKGDANIFYIDNISVRATTELITNGDFSTDATAANFSTAYPEWNVYNGSASVVSGKAELNGNSTTDSNLTTSVTCVIGKIYTLSADVFRVSGVNSFNLRVSESSGSIFDNTAIQSLNALTNTSEQTAIITFTATQETHYVGVQINGVSSTTIISLDNVSVRPAEEDRSVNGNGLQIIGEINKTPVATGADLVAYSGFSANDYLVQPYNEDLDFGTGDFCVMGWFKSSDISSTGFLIDNSDQDTTTNLNLKARFAVYKESSVLKFYTNNNVVNSEVQSSSLSSNIWYFFTAKRANGNIVLYVNGEQVDSNSDNSINLSNTSSTLAVGVNWNRSGPASSEDICLLRISKTAPTDDQIAKIYRDEKALFQDGAQATLYGTSDSVTALAYDEKTELLHVGTASGRSDFSGLRRINNTTTAITTSISAHNNLIAEQ